MAATHIAPMTTIATEKDFPPGLDMDVETVFSAELMEEVVLLVSVALALDTYKSMQLRQVSHLH